MCIKDPKVRTPNNHAFSSIDGYKHNLSVLSRFGISELRLNRMKEDDKPNSLNRHITNGAQQRHNNTIKHQGF